MIDQITDEMVAAHARRARALAGSNTPRTPGGQYQGAREDAEPSDGLPTLRLSVPHERALVPRACPRGRGHLIEADEPIGSTWPGSVACVTCGRTLVWLRD